MECHLSAKTGMYGLLVIGIVGCVLTGYGLVSVLGDASLIGILDRSSEIDSCTTIDQPGRYELTGNITNSNEDPCLEIRSSDVVLAGHGHTIAGTGENKSGYGMSIGSSWDADSEKLSNVTVQNLTVTDWSTGIDLERSNGTTVLNNTITKFGYGIRV